jgi:hypothetical protein
MEGIRSCETSVNKVSIRFHILVLHSHRRGNLKSYIILTWVKTSDMFVHLTVWRHFPFVLLAGTLKCLLHDEGDGTNWELAAADLSTARLEHLLADSSCSIAYVFSEMNIEGVRWSWDTWSSCANRRQESVHQLLRHCIPTARGAKVWHL